MNKDDAYVLYATAALIAVIIFGTASFCILEEWSILDSLYFTTYTITTVGYGDLAPSPENRLFTAMFILVCTTIVIACIGAIGNWLVARIQNRSAADSARRSEERVHRALGRLGGRSVEELDRSQGPEGKN